MNAHEIHGWEVKYLQMKEALKLWDKWVIENAAIITHMAPDNEDSVLGQAIDKTREALR